MREVYGVDISAFISIPSITANSDKMFRQRMRLLRHTWSQASFSRAPLSRNARSSRYSTSKTSNIDRITSRLPRPLRKYTAGLRNAPVSHIVAFLILHELTAIVPLIALFGVFHFTDYVPLSYMTTHFGDYVQKGVARFEKYFSRKGWFGFTSDRSELRPDTNEGGSKDRATDAVERWQGGEQRYRILVEVALAYAITKAMLPVRIIGSVWATPWFAGMLLRVRSYITGKS